MKFVMALAALALVAAPALAYTTVDLSAAGAGVYYVNDDATVWQESNGFADLQTSLFCDAGAELDGSDCVSTVDGVETRVPANPADSEVA